MTVENGAAKAEEEAAADAAFLKENVDIKYLKKTIDIGLVDTLLQQFAPAPEPAAPPPAQPEPATGQVLEPKEEQSIISKIKNFWKGTDKRINDIDSRISNLLSLHKRAKEVRALKREYEESISKKLGK